MLSWLYVSQLVIYVVVGGVAIILGLARQKPNLGIIGAIVFVEVALLVQLVASITLVVLGERAKQDTVEFFAYLIVALMVPVAAVFWALIEKTRWSTVVLGVGALTVAVMLVRMQQIWSGTLQ